MLSPKGKLHPDTFRLVLVVEAGRSVGLGAGGRQPSGARKVVILAGFEGECVFVVWEL